MDTHQPQNVNNNSCNCAFNCSDTAVLLINIDCSFWIFFTYVLKRWLSLSTNVEAGLYIYSYVCMYQMPLCSMYQMPRCVRYLYALQYVSDASMLYVSDASVLDISDATTIYVSDASMLYVSDAGGSNLPYYKGHLTQSWLIWFWS